MKYLSKQQIRESLKFLEEYNQFFGYTFLAAKRAALPVGTTTHISLDKLNHEHLNDYFTLDPRSKYYFRPLLFNNYGKFWVRPDYATKGLQRMNTGTFRDAFIHEKGTKVWGWRKNYVQFLFSKLPQGKKLPAVHLAAWLFRTRGWMDNDTRKTMVDHFLTEFGISDKERQVLFTEKINSRLSEEDAFREDSVPWRDIAGDFPVPPDVGPEQGGILSFMEIAGVGPVSPLTFEPGQRLNIVTGDNGLGKSFLLEVAWYALTGKWAVQQAYPNRGPGIVPKSKIKFRISGVSTGKVQITRFVSKEDRWVPSRDRATISGLVVYARVDGSYAVWDPCGTTSQEIDRILVLDRDEIWSGKGGKIEGLVRDWTKWQDKPQKYPFDTFLKVLGAMVPPEMGVLTPGDPVRLADDPREIPTVQHTYGDVPIIHESAGIRHIITLAYLMVWSWTEHRIKAKQRGEKPESRMVVMIDELEVHLHPRWQRVILPALLKVAEILSSELEMQLIVTAHSPLVLASAEPIFDASVDKLFHLEQTKDGTVYFKEIDFLRYGAVDSWLTSNVFRLKHARSREAEEAITEAISIQLKDQPNREDIRRIHSRLVDLLPAEDGFWARWIIFAQDHGVET